MRLFKSFLAFFALAGATLLCLVSSPAAAQEATGDPEVFSHAGIIGAVVVAVLLLILFVLIMAARVNKLISNAREERKRKERELIHEDLLSSGEADLDDMLARRKEALE
jgi:hypothetical protein